MSHHKEQKSNHLHTNSLIHENSPYLLQHAHNPVNWHPWGEAALEKARKENKLLLISIGYASCHWCHVMEHESFEDSAVAAVMNELFVAIKIDREERPDIDQIYMLAVHLLNGSGGWPLNCVALPDGRPIYGGTYFPKDQWISMLKQVATFAKEHPQETEQQADALAQGISNSEQFVQVSSNQYFTKNDLNAIVTTWKNHIDIVNGGNNGTPKFPLPCGYQFLLQYHYYTKDSEALQAVTTTLTKMAHGGIYDQIGGGFARYATDAYWQVPHFEKMLYDNAQLVSLYAATYQQTKCPLYKQIIIKTLDFICREMTAPDGTFYASIDADSEGKEGAFYLWTKTEIAATTGEHAAVVIDYYSVSEQGNWEEGKNILFRLLTNKQIALKHHITEDALTTIIATANKQLLEKRSERIHPALDHKILTAWNSLMIKAYVDAYRALGTESYLVAAKKCATILTSTIMQQDGRLTRNHSSGGAAINGFLDDYAFAIDACIALYQATFDEQWLTSANRLTSYTLDHFYSTDKKMFYYTSNNDTALIARTFEIVDNVIPSGNSQMACNLLTLGSLFDRHAYTELATTMLRNIKKDALQGGIYYANWDIALSQHLHQSCEVAIVGNDFLAMRRELDKQYLPNMLLCGGDRSATLPLLKHKLVPGATMIYVCHNKTCKQPVVDVFQAIGQIEEARSC